MYFYEILQQILDEKHLTIPQILEQKSILISPNPLREFL